MLVTIPLSLSHTHTHSSCKFPLPLSLPLFDSLSLNVSRSPFLPFSHTLSLNHTHTQLLHILKPRPCTLWPESWGRERWAKGLSLVSPLSLSRSLSLTHTHTLSLSHTHSHTLSDRRVDGGSVRQKTSLSRCLSVSLSFSISLSVSLSFSHTHTHTHTKTHTHTLSLSPTDRRVGGGSVWRRTRLRGGTTAPGQPPDRERLIYRQTS